MAWQVFSGAMHHESRSATAQLARCSRAATAAKHRKRDRVVCRPFRYQPGEPENGGQNGCDHAHIDRPRCRNPLTRSPFSMRGLFSVPAPCVQPTWRSRRFGDQGCSRHAASSQAGAVTILHDANGRTTDPRPRSIGFRVRFHVATQRECTGCRSGNQPHSRDVVQPTVTANLRAFAASRHRNSP